MCDYTQNNMYNRHKKIAVTVSQFLLFITTIMEVLSLLFPTHRVEEEAAANQKMATERTNAENKIKSLEEQVTLNEDNIAKVST